MKEIVEKIKNDPRYIKNVEYGKPRPGHPEGKVASHIKHLEENLEKISPVLNSEQYNKILFLIHTHDTFKAEAKKDSAIMDPQSHASLARKFASEFTDNKDLLNMIQFHDEDFALYKQIKSRGRYDEQRFNRLIYLIQDWNLFLLFNIVDSCTEGKDWNKTYWFLREVKKIKGDQIWVDKKIIENYILTD